MIPKAILIALLASCLSAFANGAEIRDKPDPSWASRNKWGAPGWNIVVKGEIVPDDDTKFRATLARIAQTNPHVWPVIVWLDSPGGEVVTNERIADLINHSHLWTHVDGVCASSCFLLFMAGSARFFSPDAKIGVHSVYQGQGVETPLSLAVTMLIIRKAQAYGGFTIPPSIIGKLAGTLGTSISWLSREELQHIQATMDPPEAAPVHTGTVMKRAQAFANEYMHEKPDFAAQSGGRDGVLHTWLDSYDEAYASGTNPGDCGNGYMPSTDGCLAGANDYQAVHRTR